MENGDENIKEVFACPSCGTDVDKDTKTCPGCGAIFEKGDDQPQNLEPNSDHEQLLLNPQEELHGVDTNDSEEEKVNDYLDSEDDKNNDDVPLQDSDRISNLPVSLQGLNRYKNNITFDRDSRDESSVSDEFVLEALKKYSKDRKKRYSMGTLFLGLGVVLFVMLWLVVVYDVLVTETTQWFGAHIVLILVAAGIFFTFGLFMILTYPKSSLIDVLTYMSESKNKREYSDN